MLESKFYMRQLPLEISPRAAPSLDNFVAGANAEAIVYLWGDPGSGRTHLLQAAARANSALVIADDVEALDPTAQQALFNAINAAREGQTPVLAAGGAPPGQLALRDDLRSRLGWGSSTSCVRRAI